MDEEKMKQLENILLNLADTDSDLARYCYYLTLKCVCPNVIVWNFKTHSCTVKVKYWVDTIYYEKKKWKRYKSAIKLGIILNTYYNSI